jgi:hypothetical protein
MAQRRWSLPCAGVAMGMVMFGCGDAHAASGSAPSSASASPYSLPWALRPVSLPNVLRLDTAASGSADGTVLASVLTAGLRVTSTLGLLGRIPLVQGLEGASTGAVVGNPFFGALYSPRLGGSFKVGLFMGYGLPIGMAGGDGADPREQAVMRSGIPARSAMDNALFAVNYLTKAVGVSIAYVGHGLTAQLESTAFMLFRTRGEAVDREPSRGNFTAGAHAGYALFPWLTPSVEARYQRWLSTPAAVAKDEARRDTLTVALGLRGAWQVSESVLVRPGVSYAEPLDLPLVGAAYHVVQLDLPVVFQ